MTNPDPATPTPGRTARRGPSPEPCSSTAGSCRTSPPPPGLRLPFGYHGHHEHDGVPVATVEHWLQACKATSREQFDHILACGTAAAAKRAGHRSELRPDWEQIKREVMLCALRGKFALELFCGSETSTGRSVLAV